MIFLGLLFCVVYIFYIYVYRNIAKYSEGRAGSKRDTKATGGIHSPRGDKLMDCRAFSHFIVDCDARLLNSQWQAVERWRRVRCVVALSR